MSVLKPYYLALGIAAGVIALVLSGFMAFSSLSTVSRPPGLVGLADSLATWGDPITLAEARTAIGGLRLPSALPAGSELVALRRASDGTILVAYRIPGLANLQEWVEPIQLVIRMQRGGQIPAIPTSEGQIIVTDHVTGPTTTYTPPAADYSYVQEISVAGYPARGWGARDGAAGHLTGQLYVVIDDVLYSITADTSLEQLRSLGASLA